MKAQAIKIRWITTCCFEVVLPNGKVLLFDPWTGKSEGYPKFQVETGLTPEDFTGADYVFLTHAHFDHVDDAACAVKKLCKDTYGGHIYAPALSAKLIADMYDIPYREIIPVFPNESFETDDLIIDIYPCRHFGDQGAPIGPCPSTNARRAAEKGQTEWQTLSGALGSLEEIDIGITIKENNFRFMMLGGRIYKFHNVYKRCETFHPNFVICQLSPGFSPEDYADICHRYHAPLVFPSHHDSHNLEKARGTTYEAYFSAVNQRLREMHSATQVVHIVPDRWYSVGSYCDLTD